ncbi:MAG TPA: sn-glycerol-3-phosphate ABC transporter ATP-binding protein UgpC [Kribbella sp.]
MPADVTSFVQVSKSFGSTEVLKEFSLEIEDGEFIVIVGPSGCGKSTLLRLVAGLETITSGEIYFADRLANKMPSHQRDIGMVFQNYALYPHMTVYKNLVFGLESSRTPKAVMRERVKEIAGLLEISELLDKKPKTLSGGQRQRIAVGRALIRRPRLFLMDEPLSNLDAQLRERMRVDIRGLHDQVGVTTLYVTHDQTEAMTMADRIVVLNEGRCEQIGTPAELYRYPASRFVASFIGAPSMNLLPVTVERRSAGWELTSMDAADSTLRLQFGSEWDGALAAHSAVWLGARPESLSLQSAEQTLAIPVDVRTTEVLGARTTIHTSWGAAPVALSVETQWNAEFGQHLMAHVPLDALHFFDHQSGRRLSAAVQDVAA